MIKSVGIIIQCAIVLVACGYGGLCQVRAVDRAGAIIKSKENKAKREMLE